MLEEHRQAATKATKKLRSEVASSKAREIEASRLVEQKDIQLLKVQANVMEMCGEFAETAREEERTKYANQSYHRSVFN